MVETELPPLEAKGFKGLNNRLQPPELGLEWLLDCRDFLCDNSRYLVVRPGVTEVAAGYKDVYGAQDGRLLLVTHSDTLVERDAHGVERTLFAGVSGAPFLWTELGDTLFLMSETAQWAVYPDRCIPWGSLCPMPDPAAPIDAPVVYPPPTGEAIAARRNQLMVGYWDPETYRSAVYFSRPGYPHEFYFDRDFILVPGRVTLLASNHRGVVIGTDREIYVDPIDAPLQKVADYGAPKGCAALDERGDVFFWTARGLCKCFPFENVTDKQYCASIRSRVAAGVLPWRGSVYCVANQSGPEIVTAQHTRFEPRPILTVHENGITL